MAGDWIKVEKNTARKPEVLRIAAALGIHPDEAFGLCFRFWCWCDDHLESANAAGVSNVLVDALVERKGFADALISVGWLRAREGSLEIPNMDRHLSQTAKKRAVTAQRVARHTHKTNAKTNAGSVSPSLATALAREEKSKRRVKSSKEDLTPPNPQGGDPRVTFLEVDGELLEHDGDPSRWVAEFVRRWNELPGAVKSTHLGLSTSNHRLLLDRLAEPDWYWKRAFEQFPLYVPDGVWQITLGTFLKPETVSRILEGNYDKSRYERDGAGLFNRDKDDPTKIRTGKTSAAISDVWAAFLASGGESGEVGADSPGDPESSP